MNDASRNDSTAHAGAPPHPARPKDRAAARLRLLTAGLVGLAAMLAGGAVVAAPSLSRSEVPATGRQEAILQVDAPGRYVLSVASRQGTALQLVDRMPGPGPVAGIAGKEDGRLDLFLDVATYKLVALSSPQGTGSARLTVKPFAELHAQPASLIELRPVRETLDDAQQASWWLDVTQARDVAVEAAGRHLADLRLWRDGTWLVDADPEREVIQPRPGEPLLACRLAVHLEPGAYLLTAYGGPEQPWSTGSSESPLLVRWGIPRLAEAGRRRFATSDFGIDRHVVPGTANFVRIEVSEARPLALSAATYDSAHPFASPETSTSIAKDTAPPVAELELAPQEGSLRVLTVTAEAGQPYVLQHFLMQRDYPFSRAGGDYWISDVHSGDPNDSIDATAIVTRVSWRDETRHETPVVARAVALDSQHAWARRFNLTGNATLFLDVKEAGSYELLVRGVGARGRIEPFFDTPPEGYEAPALQGSGATWDLDAGYHVLTLVPDVVGIVEAGVRRAGSADRLLDRIGEGPDVGGPSAWGSVTFGKVTLVRDDYVQHGNEQPDVRVGVVLRPWPLDLSEALPLTQRPGDDLNVAFVASEAATVHADPEGDARVELSVDGGEWAASVPVERGRHDVVARVRGARTVVYSLVATPRSVDPATPPAPPPAAGLTTPPALPLLSVGTPLAFDLARGGSATFALRADQPALYRVETTGLLATAGSLRMRMAPGLARAEGGGSGRNVLMQSYLREGDYQVTVRALGESAGHVGLKLSRAPARDGGMLALGARSRATLAAGEAIAYTFEVAEADDYRIESLGLGRAMTCRLEDADGWPIETPGIEASLTRHLDAGSYRFIVLPTSAGARAVTLVERVPEPLHFEGHGPHRLPLGQRVEHVWREPAEGAERQPDAWDFVAPAAMDVMIAATGNVDVAVTRLGGAASVQPSTPDPGGVDVGHAGPSRPWKGRLERGPHRLLVRGARVDDRVAYGLTVTPDQLVAGTQREVTAPADVPVSVGEEGQVEITSTGRMDVRARLTDARGALVAQADDAPDDWNFRLAARGAPGAYVLRIEPVGTESATTTIFMRAPKEREQEALVLPAHRDLEPRDDVLSFAVELPRNADVLVVSAKASQDVGLAVDAGDDAQAWRGAGNAVGRAPRLVVPLPERVRGVAVERLRVRVWSGDGAPGPVHLDALAVSLEPVRESTLARGASLVRVDGASPPLALAAVELDRPGVLRLDEAAREMTWSVAGGRECGPVEGDALAIPHGRAWIAAEGALASRRARAHRVSLDASSGPRLAVRAWPNEPISCDVTSGKGAGSLLVAARARGGQPGVRIVVGGGDGAPASDARELVAWSRGAATVASGAAHATVLAWRADDGTDPLDVELSATTFTVTTADAVGEASLSGAVEGTSARAFELPEGIKDVRLVLGAGLIAALGDEHAVRTVHGGADVAIDERVETDATRLLLLRAEPGRAAFTVDVVPHRDRASPRAPLTLEQPVEERFSSTGTLRLDMSAPGEAARLHVRGASARARVQSAAGSIRSGVDVALDSGESTLLLDHGRGPVLAWIDARGRESEGPWPASAGAVALVDVRPPALVRLSGREAAWRVQAPPGSLLHVRASESLVTRLAVGDDVRVEAHPSGASLDVLVPDGTVELRLRALGGGEMEGEAVVTTSPVANVGEGLGPEVLLGADDARGFAFDVSTQGPVGLGVRASAGDVDARLLDAFGRTVGEGVAQLHDLMAGTYVLLVHAPAGGAPVLVQSAVAGLTPQPTGPPANVVRDYLAAAEAASPLATGTAPPDHASERESARSPEGDDSGMAPESSDEGGEASEGGD